VCFGCGIRHNFIWNNYFDFYILTAEGHRELTAEETEKLNRTRPATCFIRRNVVKAGDLFYPPKRSEGGRPVLSAET
jgi:hypothetical protein